MQLDRKQIKTLLETAPSVEEADEIINKTYAFKSIREKVAFLKDMFDIKIVGHEESEPDEMTYFAMLATVISN